MVHVAREREDRGGRLAALPRADLALDLGQALEGLVEGAPVLQVELLAHLLARRAASAPQAPPHTASFQASRWCMAGDSSHGSEVAISRWSKPPHACSSTQSHSSSSSIERLPSSSTRPARESIITSRVSPRSRW